MFHGKGKRNKKNIYESYFLGIIPREREADSFQSLRHDGVLDGDLSFGKLSTSRKFSPEAYVLCFGHRVCRERDEDAVRGLPSESREIALLGASCRVLGAIDTPRIEHPATSLLLRCLWCHQY